MVRIPHLGLAVDTAKRPVHADLDQQSAGCARVSVFEEMWNDSEVQPLYLTSYVKALFQLLPRHRLTRSGTSVGDEIVFYFSFVLLSFVRSTVLKQLRM